MSDKLNDGGPAFPVQELNPDGTPYNLTLGLSLRDYFAAKAMQGMLAAGPAWDFAPHVPAQRVPSALTADLALTAYDIADAMLKARDA